MLIWAIKRGGTCGRFMLMWQNKYNIVKEKKRGGRGKGGRKGGILAIFEHCLGTWWYERIVANFLK